MIRFAPPARLAMLIAGCGLSVFLAACSSDQIRDVGRDEYAPGSRRERMLGRLTGGSDDGGIVLLGPARGRSREEPAGVGLGVNAFLWRASLDTLSFMPLASADPFGGVIITDWYSPPGAPNERFKATAYVMGRQLRSDGIRVSIFRQVRSGGGWIDAPLTPAIATEIEDRILARARELRAQTASR